MSINLLFVLVLFITMGCGCEPDPIEPDYPMEITTASLDGTWEFVSAEFLGYSVSTCAGIPTIPTVTDAALILSFEFDAVNETVTITDACPTLHPLFEDYIYEVIPPTIYIRPDPSSGPLAYTIISYDNILGILVLEMPVMESDFTNRKARVTLQKI